MSAGGIKVSTKREKKCPVLVVTLGDAAGIGPEVIVKALAVEKLRQRACFFIVGDQRILQQGIEVAGRGFEFEILEHESKARRQPGKVYMLDQGNLAPGDFAIGQVSAETGRAMGQDLARAVSLVQDGLADGMVFGPLTKAALNLGGYEVKDELHYLAQLVKMPAGAVYGEINKMGRLWLGRVTSHVALKDIVLHINKESILNGLQLLVQTMSSYGGKPPKILVAALNPHAGDGGLFGTEENEIIAPAVSLAQQRGISASGPYPADTIFLRYIRGQGDGILAMYHDQGHGPIKVLGLEAGVNITVGLPVIRTSVDHGTAFDIAGTGVADERSLIEALRQAVELAPKSQAA
jgi:4-hydroxythreonine-4-phosphate dehydrogenase